MLKNFRLKFWEPKDLSWDGVLYRIIMRIAHKYDWHYMPPYPEIEFCYGTSPRLWCQWCGISTPEVKATDLHGSVEK